MNLEINKEIAQRFIQYWGKSGLNIINELASPEILVHYQVFPGPIKGISIFKQVISAALSIFTDSEMRVDDVIAEGNKVVLRWSFSATHNGEFPPGVQRTGKRVTWTGINIYQIEGGKIVEMWAEENLIALFRQIGLIPHL
jgi:predicted ester cyclase